MSKKEVKNALETLVTVEAEATDSFAMAHGEVRGKLLSGKAHEGDEHLAEMLATIARKVGYYREGKTMVLNSGTISAFREFASDSNSNEEVAKNMYNAYLSS